MKQNPFNSLASEYEAWFIENKVLFQSELLALKQVIPVNKKGIEIGVGSRIFAGQLGIRSGLTVFYKHSKTRSQQVWRIRQKDTVRAVLW